MSRFLTYENCKKYKKVWLVIFTLVFIAILLSFYFSSTTIQNKRNDAGSFYVQNHPKGYGAFLIATSSTVVLFERGVDGDTLEVSDLTHKSIYRVRIIGINAPESVDPHRSPECFGKEASMYLGQLFEKGTRLRLQHDFSQDYLDVFGRSLAYIEHDGEDIGLKILSNGYAYEYTWNMNNPYERQMAYKGAEGISKRSKVGIWGKCKDKNNMH